jgi:hypothetical protein
MSIKWLKAAAIRAVRTIAQAAIATIGTAVVISEVDWKYIVSASLLAGILSILTSLAGLPEVKDDSFNPDLLDEITDGRGIDE